MEGCREARGWEAPNGDIILILFCGWGMGLPFACQHVWLRRPAARPTPPPSGMTGTAATEVSEFDSIYKLPVAVVPTNRAILRKDNPDVVFRWEWAAADVQGLGAGPRGVRGGGSGGTSKREMPPFPLCLCPSSAPQQDGEEEALCGGGGARGLRKDLVGQQRPCSESSRTS
jgi:hypothetical protein